MAPFDVDYPRAVLLGLLVVVNLALVGAATTSGAPYGPYNGAWDGSSEARTLATEESAVTLAHSTVSYEEARPADTVAVIVAPQRRYGPTDLARVRSFLGQGGTLVVAADDNRTNRLLDELDVTVRIDGQPVRDEQEHYRAPSLPVATEVSDHPLTADVDGLTLNHGTVLNVSKTGERPGVEEWTGEYLINTSGFGYVDRNGNEELDDDEILRERPVAVTEPVGSGQVVVISDASVFTNAMLDREGNEQFLRNVVGSSETVLLDYARGHPLPPLLYALLVIRSAPLVQFGLGALALGGVVVWARGLPEAVREWVPTDGNQGETTDAGSLDAEEFSAFLASEHPDWDDDRVQHVTKAILRSRGQSRDND